MNIDDCYGNNDSSSSDESVSSESESESELIEQEIITDDDFYFTTFDYDIL